MEPMEKVTNCSKDPFAEKKDPRYSCFECFANTPCYNALKAQYSIRNSRPRFLSTCAFKKRLKMEFALSRKALVKFLESKGAQPIVDLPDLDTKLKTSFTVWELARSMSEWMRSSFFSVMAEKKAPIIDEPIPSIKEFPLTQESVKKHIEKETAKKKEEKQETVLSLKKKQEDLKKLKDELKLQTEKQYCHYNERLEDYEIEKIKYLRRLADEHNLRLKDLIKNGDVIYENYRSEMKKCNERKIREIEKKAEANARLLQEELTRQKQLKKLKSSSVPKLIIKKPKKITPELSQLAEEEEDESRSVSFSGLVRKSKERMSVESLMRPSKWKLAKSAQTIKSRQRVNTSRSVIRLCKPKALVSANKVEQDLNQVIKKLENVWDEIDSTWSDEKKAPELPDNDSLIIRPTSIVFKDFLPFDEYLKTIKVYNPTKEAIDCGVFKYCVEPQFDEKMFEVFPELVMRVRPGGSQNFQVIFMTVRWDEVKDGINGTIWFWSKVLKTNNYYRIAVPVHCIRFITNIIIENPIIEFGQVPSWIHFSSTKYLEITNHSKIEYEVFIHRKNQKMKTDSFLGSTSTEIESTHVKKRSTENLIGSINNIQQQSSVQAIPEKTKRIRYKDSETQEQPADRKSQEQPKHRESSRRLSSVSRVSRKSRLSLASRKFSMKLEGLLAAKDLLESVIEEVYQPFRIQLTRGVFLNPETKMCVPIEFLPQLAGGVERVVDQLVVSFEGRWLTKDEEVVTLIATMFELPISISPAIVDMQVTMVGTGVWQTSFQVANVSNKFVKVKVQIPDKINKHFQARPTNFIIRPKGKEDVLLRAKIGWNIDEDSGDMLDESLSLLEFPISIQADDLPNQTLGALAIISKPLALSIEPKTINLGFVNTFETVVEEFWLKNNTVAPLQFAFINVPKCCLIMPMYGFSTIGPAQKIKLHLLYSPGVREAGKAGGQAVHMFTLTCTTMERLAAEDPPFQKFNPEEEVVKNSKVQYKDDNEQLSTLQELLKLSSDEYATELGEPNASNLETLSFLNENINAISFVEKKEVISPAELSTIERKTTTFETIYSGDSLISEKSSMEDIDMTGMFLPKKKDIELFLTLNCMAMVTDPICELSAQEIILPDTPYGSYSITSIYLKCPNESSGNSCHCGKFVGLRDNPKQFHVRFQFFHPMGKELDIQPISGNLSYNEKIKIYIILRPELDIQESSKELRSKLKKTKSRSKASKSSKQKNDSKATLRNVDYISKIKLLKVKNKPISNYQTRVRCLVSVMGPEIPQSRYEELYCDLFYKFVRPDIYVATPNSKKEIIFPKTAIGAKRLETITVFNVSNELVYVTRSHFSHKDIFSCTALPPSPWSYSKYKGIPLEPDEFLKLRLTFSPVEDNYAEEYFELKANNTIISLKVSGYGVVPRYIFSSQFSVCRLEAYPGSKVEDTIINDRSWNNDDMIYLIIAKNSFGCRNNSKLYKQNDDISNKCEVELRFEIMKCFQMETTSSDVFRMFQNKYTPNKNIHKELHLDESIITDIEEKFHESDQPIPITVEPHLISIAPYKKAAIKICFFPKRPASVSSNILKLNKSEEAKVNEASAIISQLYSKSKIEEASPTFYVKKVQLVLGRLTLVAEWLIIGKVTKDNKKRV